MKQVTRPSTQWLQELEDTQDPARLAALRTTLRDFLAEGVRHAAELKAYQKILADAQRNSRSDPNSQLWLSQLEDKNTRHQQCLDAIDSLSTHAAQAVDRHARSEAVATIRSLVQDGFFDKPLLPRTTQQPPSSTASTADPASSTLINTLQKGLDNERGEREDSIQALKHQFEEFRTFSNHRFEEFQKRLDEYKEANDTRIHHLAEQHRKEINSLKAGYQLTQIKHSQKPSTPPPGTHAATPTQQQQNDPPIHPEELRSIVHQQVQRELAKQLEATDPKDSCVTLIQDVRTQLDELTQLTTTTLQEFQPEIKQLTHSIQLEVIKSAKTVITSGHDDITSLIQELVTKIQEQVDELKPIINQSSAQIHQLDSSQKDIYSQVHEQLESRLKELAGQVGSIESKLLTREDLDHIYVDAKEMQEMKKQIYDAETNSNQVKGGMSQTINEIRSSTSAQCEGIKRTMDGLVRRVDEMRGRVEGLDERMMVQPRYSTPTQQRQHRTSQTPPSPERPVEPSGSDPATRSSPYLPPPNHSRNYHHDQPPPPPAKLSDHHLHGHARNIPIAARLTNAPSTSNTQAARNNHPNLAGGLGGGGKMKQTRSREPSLTVAGQTSNALVPNQKPGYNYSATTGQDPTTSGGGDHQQSSRYSQPANTSPVPLAKRLKSFDFNPHPPHYHHYHRNGNGNGNAAHPSLVESMSMNNPPNHLSHPKKTSHPQTSRRN